MPLPIYPERGDGYWWHRKDISRTAHFSLQVLSPQKRSRGTVRRIYSRAGNGTSKKLLQRVPLHGLYLENKKFKPKNSIEANAYAPIHHGPSCLEKLHLATTLFCNINWRPCEKQSETQETHTKHINTQLPTAASNWLLNHHSQVKKEKDISKLASEGTSWMTQEFNIPKTKTKITGNHPNPSITQKRSEFYLPVFLHLSCGFRCALIILMFIRTRITTLD